MNRKERRAAAKRGRIHTAQIDADSEVAGINEPIIEARERYRLGQYAQAENICNQILSREPSHVGALSLLGVIAQNSDRHKTAIKLFSKVISGHESDAPSHYGIAISFQASGQQDQAAEHFRQAIILGMTDNEVIAQIAKNPIIAANLARLAAEWPLLVKSDELFGGGRLEHIATDAFFRAAMVSIVPARWDLEVFLTQLRAALLRLAAANTHLSRLNGDCVDDCFCALAQQCFISEYVFAQSDEETRVANQLREILKARLLTGNDLPAFLVAAVAAYFPLFSVAEAESLLQREWPASVRELLRQQIVEPMEEARDRSLISALTSVEDTVTMQVMHQYEENPYPRWILNPLKLLAPSEEKQTKSRANNERGPEILVAGCGTGLQVFQISRVFPDARILAIDISLASLAYARRKTREEGLLNIEYAQADILKLKTIGRSFDRVEAMGVLHHLANPKAGWRVLLDLLRPNGEMRIGLYSDIARRGVVEVRRFIAERGFRATVEDIRECRQQMLRGTSPRWSDITSSADFYNTSGCRDMLFNVMEHRFTISEIKVFLCEHNLSFIGFELDPETIARFQERYPHAALNDLAYWDEFEAEHPKTFSRMYAFSIRKNALARS